MSQPMDSDFNHQIYILASVCHIKDHAARLPPKCNNIEQKHLNLLDYLALLLVTKPRGDVAAVTMEISNSALHFYYAKNRPCDPSIQAYVDRIIKILQENKPEFIPKFVLMNVMEKCVDKVRDRIRKCQKALEEFEGLGIPLDSLSGNIAANAFKPWAGLNDSEILRTFFEELRSFDTSILIMKLLPTTSMLISQKACFIGVGDILIQYPNLRRRIQKLGAYFGAVLEIAELLIRPEYSKLVSNIRFTEVIPPAQQIVQIPKSICTLLNEDASKKDQEYVSAEDINARFPEIGPETTGNATVTTSNHCELTLVLRALDLQCPPTPIKIGVSKRVCWLCEQYLDHLSHSQNVRILVSEYQGKIHAGWRIPECTPEDVKKKMHNLVDEEVTEIRELIINRRKSDSFPLESREFLAEIIQRSRAANCLDSL